MLYRGETAVLTTKHSKEQVIAPLFAEVLGMKVVVHAADTDQLGTFCGTVPRAGTMEQTVMAKAKLGLEATGLSFGIASEGAFGPHPSIPLIAADTEMMVFIDKKRDFVLIERLTTIETDYHPETNRDMRAHLNPLRMKAIAGVCQKLVRRLTCHCPRCNLPGFGLVDLKEGLPCENCGALTTLIQEEIDGCVKCPFRQIRPYPKELAFPPSFYCPYCNP